MATAAGIDQVVHHPVILEFDVPSYRTGVAQQRGQELAVTSKTGHRQWQIYLSLTNRRPSAGPY